MPIKTKKNPATIEEAREAMQIVKLGKNFYIVCKNQNQNAKLYKIIFNAGELERLLNERKEKLEFLVEHEKRLAALENEINEVKKILFK